MQSRGPGSAEISIPLMQTGLVPPINNRSKITTDPAMYTHILVPVDGSATSKKGLDEAIALAQVTGASLRLVHVVEDPVFATGLGGFDPMGLEMIPLLREAGEKLLGESKTRVTERKVAVQTVLLERLGSRIGDAVVQEARECRADLIVLGTHGRRGIRRLTLGSDAEQIARLASVPVLLVRSPDEVI
jgi:nucleotide-binding universal stress UspA family protein